MNNLTLPGISQTKKQMTHTNEDALNELDCILVSLVVLNDEGRGHHYTYAEAVGRSAKIIGWTHLAAISKEYSDKDIPHNWKACLACRNLITIGQQSSVFSRLGRVLVGNAIDSYKLATSTACYLREITQRYPTGRIILLVDSFFSNELLAILYSLLIFSQKSRLYVWFLYRYELTPNRIYVYRFLNRIIELIFPVSHINLLTDSETLKDYLSGYFNRSFDVVPIPHTPENFSKKISRNQSEILAWWPGAPRANKGLAILQKLASNVYDSASNICIIAARSSQLQQVVGGVKIELIDDVLSREDYINLLHTVDIILLPYDPILYRLQTSGIFTESVCAGKIPLVREGTWMASELRKHGLETLILDWESPNVFSQITEITNNLVIREKLATLQERYMNYHSERGYAETMKKLMDAYL